MKPILCTGLLLLMTSGCHWPFLDKGAEERIGRGKSSEVRTVRPVVPEEVTAQTAHAISQRLWDELDQEELRLLSPMGQ